MNNCLNCGYANWERTKSGSLHPSGNGKCVWEMPVIDIPVSFYYIGHVVRQTVVAPDGGGFINRKLKPSSTKECKCWIPIEPKQ